MGEQTHFWNKWRFHFRMCRICLLSLILALVCAVLWLNQIGLPNFAKQPIIDALRQRGIALQFVRLRLNFIHGLVADNVRIGGYTPDSPSLALQEFQLQVNYNALLHRKLQLDGVVLRQGTLTLPVSATNDPARVLTIDHIQADLRFETNDVWSLDNFQASFAGARFILSGRIFHASAAANWKIFQGAKGGPGIAHRPPQFELKKIGSTLSQIHFDNASQLSLNLTADARDFRSFLIRLAVSAPAVQTPWGSARNVVLVARSVTPPGYPDVISPALPDIHWKSRLTRLRSKQLNADFISCDGFWSSPEVDVTNLFARLGGGQLHASARLNLDTREFSFTNSSHLDPQAIAALLTSKTRERLDQFTFPQPPELWASGSLILPAWTNRAPDWRDDVQPTIRLDGRLAATNPAVNGYSLNEARLRFSYSNEVWTVPEATIIRGGSRLEIQGNESDETRDYQWRLRGALEVGLIRPFLNVKAAREFTRFVFAQPLYIDTRVRGRLYDYDSISAEGHAALTNFSIRGSSVDSAETDFHYAHLVASFYHPHLEAPGQWMRADGVCLDWPGDRIYFTNGLGTAYPQLIADAIGPEVSHVMSPYHFLQPPTVIVTGYAPLRDPTNADLDFKSVGFVQVEVLKVRTPALSGEIHWIGQTLLLTNFSASLYGGAGNANAFFNFPLHKPADFSFTVDVQNVDGHGLATDLNSPTNHLEGLLSGHFVLTSGSSDTWRSCNGYGDATLRNGLLWDVPLFGFLSPVLNAITPGLGSLRATDASAQFFMTNGVISTDSLNIHTPMMQLRYNGTVDLQGRLDAHVTGELLRDVPGIGPVVNFLTSPVTKILEYKVTGTLKEPKYKPVYIPNFLFYMLHPIHSLEGLLPPPPPNQKEWPQQGNQNAPK